MAMTFLESPIQCEDIEEAKTRLADQGWAVLSMRLLQENPRSTLLRFGRITPQYDGKETWEVQVKPGFETLPYSQSSNGIGAHTEAPVMDPPPKYLALHCHQQARCGGGHTVLADGLIFCARNGGKQRFSELSAEFAATPIPGSVARRNVRVPLLSDYGEGIIFRFSYNQFRYGDVNPSEDAIVSPETALNQDAELVRLADLAEEFFQSEGVALLVPVGALLIWDNHRMMHARGSFEDKARHLTRYWLM